MSKSDKSTLFLDNDPTRAFFQLAEVPSFETGYVGTSEGIAVSDPMCFFLSSGSENRGDDSTQLGGFGRLDKLGAKKKKKKKLVAPEDETPAVLEAPAGPAKKKPSKKKNYADMSDEEFRDAVTAEKEAEAAAKTEVAPDAPAKSDAPAKKKPSEMSDEELDAAIAEEEEKNRKHKENKLKRTQTKNEKAEKAPNNEKEEPSLHAESKGGGGDGGSGPKVKQTSGVTKSKQTGSTSGKGKKSKGRWGGKNPLVVAFLKEMKEQGMKVKNPFTKKMMTFPSLDRKIRLFKNGDENTEKDLGKSAQLKRIFDKRFQDWLKKDEKRVKQFEKSQKQEAAAKEKAESEHSTEKASTATKKLKKVVSVEARASFKKNNKEWLSATRKSMAQGAPTGRAFKNGTDVKAVSAYLESKEGQEDVTKTVVGVTRAAEEIRKTAGDQLPEIGATIAETLGASGAAAEGITKAAGVLGATNAAMEHSVKQAKKAAAIAQGKKDAEDRKRMEEYEERDRQKMISESNKKIKEKEWAPEIEGLSSEGIHAAHAKVWEGISSKWKELEANGVPDIDTLETNEDWNKFHAMLKEPKNKKIYDEISASAQKGDFLADKAHEAEKKEMADMERGWAEEDKARKYAKAATKDPDDEFADTLLDALTNISDKDIDMLKKHVKQDGSFDEMQLKIDLEKTNRKVFADALLDIAKKGEKKQPEEKPVKKASLRARMIRLAFAQPETRPYLLPLLVCPS